MDQCISALALQRRVKMNPILEKIFIGAVTLVVIAAAVYVIYLENKPEKKEISSDSKDK